LQRLGQGRNSQHISFIVCSFNSNNASMKNPQTASAKVRELSIVQRSATLAKTILEEKVTQMIKEAAALALSFALMAAPMLANEGPVPRGVPH
jgi:hypothetical protein